MDDNFAQPGHTQRVPHTQENETELSGDEDEVPDWTKLKAFASTSSSSSKPSLPKRGDKEFEPSNGGPSSLQSHTLDRARDAMFSALQTERGISNKSISVAIWYPEISRAAVIQARGVLFNGIGHSAPRPVASLAKLQKRMELLPEEALYLIERGSLFCWNDSSLTKNVFEAEGKADVPEDYRMHGIPMTVQQAYAEMIGKDDLTLEKYHAYAYLKRLGFNVLRTHPPSVYYPTPPSLVTPSNPSLSRRISSSFQDFFARLWRRLFGRIDWWRPVRKGFLFGCARNYPSLYRILRFIPSGHGVTLHPHPYSQPSTTSLYTIFYNVYKPNTPFRKTAPPAPDFSLVVVDARTTSLPTLHELTNLWSQLPETGPPLPRQKNHGKATKSSFGMKPPTLSGTSTPVSSQHKFWIFNRLFSWFSHTKSPENNVVIQTRPPHPFAVLKNGKKTVVIGVVDCGTVSFYRFSLGAFEEMPLI
ncbi:hypothetical protein Clacol_010162 [Clathrus columnatus]|uniref:tRNA-splicing endonuclease subunit Sen54 N-terminal domain-containing protein n=1 Tax=Clathrus columnatus TaxID=1419009 RepID=A0AAV5AMQ0_9AGAM|nr:hypothetical protein Clacol_010162 [Clathrus columnatus]